MTQTLTAVEPTTSSRLGRRLWAILAVVLIADAIDLMDSTIMNIAAPTIQREIGGGEGLIKWLGASYALALGILLVVGGRLGDRFGRRRLFLIGIAGFGVASVLCAVAIDPAFLIAARLLQGAFGALLIPQGIGILIATFSREQFPTAASMFGPVLGGASIVGPILAGFLVGANIGGLTWRPMFLINIVLCAAGLIAGWKLLPPDRDLQKVSIDGLGSALLAVGMLGVLFGLIQGSTNGWTAVPVICLGLGVAGFIGFALRQRLATNPLIVPALFHNRGFTSGLLIGLGYFAVVNGFAYVVSLYFQMHLGLSPVGAALAMMPMMVGIIIASFVARPLIPKLGRNLVVAGLATTLAGIVALIAISIAAETPPTSGCSRRRSSCSDWAWARRSAASTTSRSAISRRTSPVAHRVHCRRCSSWPRPSARRWSPRSTSRPRQPPTPTDPSSPHSSWSVPSPPSASSPLPCCRSVPRRTPTERADISDRK